MILYEIPRQARQADAPFSVYGSDPACDQPCRPLRVEPGLRFHLPQGAHLISTQLSGGSLPLYLKEQRRLWGESLWLLIEPMCHLFPLPCPDGVGREIEAEESRRLQAARCCYHAPEFLCQYCVLRENGQLAVHLFDTEQTLGEKLALAKRLEIINIIYIMLS